MGKDIPRGRSKTWEMIQRGIYRVKSKSSRYLQTGIRPSDDSLGGAWWLPKTVDTRHITHSTEYPSVLHGRVKLRRRDQAVTCPRVDPTG
jgi:hypothetical protein